ncbi:MAG: hypothetical protein H6Q75_18 [Firmicutes bacterium]|nr:hypothetical protein [Bacillota bacterium]
MRKVVVSVIGTQDDASGEQNKIELVTKGTRYDKTGVSYVTYREEEASGMGGSTTLLKVFSDHFVVVRRGAIEQQMEFFPNRKCESRVTTPYGVITVCVDTKKIETAFGGKTMSLYAVYDLEINNKRQSSNTIAVSVREDE